MTRGTRRTERRQGARRPNISLTCSRRTGLTRWRRQRNCFSTLLMSASRKLVLPAGRGLKLEQLGLDARLNLEQKEERIELQKSMHKRNVLAVTKEEEEDDI